MSRDGPVSYFTSAEATAYTPNVVMITPAARFTHCIFPGVTRSQRSPVVRLGTHARQPV